MITRELKLKLTKETVIAPDVQNLTITISKPLLSTPKEFQLKLTLGGSAVFSDNTKEKVIESAQISESQTFDEIIKIEKSALGTGEIINLSYYLSYKSSFFGRIDENFRIFQGSLSFRGAACEKAACEVTLNQCNDEKASLNQQISDLNNQIIQKDNELNSLKKRLKKFGYFFWRFF